MNQKRCKHKHKFSSRFPECILCRREEMGSTTFNKGDMVVSLIETYRPVVEKVVAIDNRKEFFQQILCEVPGHGELWRSGVDYRPAQEDEVKAGYRLHPEKLGERV